MPRGIPASGRRMTQKAIQELAIEKVVAPIVPEVIETDDQIEARLKERFDILALLTNAAIDGEARAVIVSGPAGLGKSFTVEQALETWDPLEERYTIVKGFVKATGLYKLLYQFRHAGSVIVFDDADAIFGDDITLNMLKAVCDTTERRKVSYLAEINLVDEESAERLPRSFTFEGTIIFITNMDFDALIERGNRLAPHLQAMISRAHYIDLAMKTRQDYLVRIKQVVQLGMLREKGYNKDQETDVLAFIGKYKDNLRELSLRVVLKIASLRKMSKNWESLARTTCCKGLS